MFTVYSNFKLIKDKFVYNDMWIKDMCCIFFIYSWEGYIHTSNQTCRNYLYSSFNKNYQITKNLCINSTNSINSTTKDA